VGQRLADVVSTHSAGQLTDVDHVFVDGDGNPGPRPEMLVGDKGYRADWIGEYRNESGRDPVIADERDVYRGELPSGLAQVVTIGNTSAVSVMTVGKVDPPATNLRQRGSLSVCRWVWPARTC